VMMLVYGQEMMAADDALGVTDDAGGVRDCHCSDWVWCV